MDKKTKKQVTKSTRLDFLFDLYNKKVELKPEQIKELEDGGYIEKKKIKGPKQDKKLILSDPKIKSERGIEADKHIEIVDVDESSDKDVIIHSAEGKEDLMSIDHYRFDGDMSITAEDWLPISKTEHEPEFIEWIDSINSGFQKMKKFKKFSLYVQQASDWYSENGSITDYNTAEQQEVYALEEMRRCKENTLYFLNKYLMLKEGDMSSGARTYDAKPVHEVISYLFDCGYSMMIGKPRQIAATSTLGGCALKKIVFYRNFFLKFITQDKETGIEIFEDKIKYPFSELPGWMQPTVSNDRDNLFRLSRKVKKGTTKGVNPKLQVVAPSVSAINGGSPPLVMVDDAGYIGILGKMIKEARPTMFMQDPVSKKLIMKRQIVIWGTGGEMDKGGKAYEEEYMNTMKKWQNREFETGIIPIFFDWTTRPGITREFYESERAAYTVDGPDKEERLVQFRQTYPSIVEDMFLTSNKTLVSIDYINRQLERIRELPQELKPQKGFFEPIFDQNTPAGENEDVPFKIIGVNFVPTEDADPRASCTIFMHPKPNWINRYYSGVDPVMSDNGYSNMASAVIDVVFNTVAAIVNYRDSDHRYTFLQTMLLGLYYDTKSQGKGRVKELVEANIGTAYCDYVETKGFYNSLVYRTELPVAMQGGGHVVGIDNRSARTRFIINMLHEFIKAFGDRVYIDTFFIQLRTFICTITASGNETWGTADKRKYHDDVLFAVVFAYICSLSYTHLQPKEIKSEEDRYKISYELRRDKDGMLERVPVRKKIF